MATAVRGRSTRAASGQLLVLTESGVSQGQSVLPVALSSERKRILIVPCRCNRRPLFDVLFATTNHFSLAPKRGRNVSPGRWIKLVSGIRNGVSLHVGVGDVDLFAARGLEINGLRSQILLDRNSDRFHHFADGRRFRGQRDVIDLSIFGPFNVVVVTQPLEIQAGRNCLDRVFELRSFIQIVTLGGFEIGIINRHLFPVDDRRARLSPFDFAAKLVRRRVPKFPLIHQCFFQDRHVALFAKISLQGDSVFVVGLQLFNQVIDFVRGHRRGRREGGGNEGDQKKEEQSSHHRDIFSESRSVRN
jgi:hypothetical protein